MTNMQDHMHIVQLAFDLLPSWYLFYALQVVNRVNVHGKVIASFTFLMFIGSRIMLLFKICKLVALLLLRHILSMTGADDEDASTFFMVIVREIEGGEV